MPALEPAEARCLPPRAASGALSRAKREARRLVREDALLAPAWSFRLLPVDAVRGSVVEAGGAALHASALAELAGRFAAVAAAACTLGPAVEARIASLFASRERVLGAHARLLAMALDEVATERLFALCDQVHARIVREAQRRGLRAGLPAHPGDPGVALGAQAQVLRLSGMDEQKVCAMPSGMLNPVKSLTFVVAIGADLPERESAPRCARCASRERCSVRT